MGDTGELTNPAREWQLNEYIAYSGGVDYLAWEQNRVNGPLATASGFYPLFEDATITSQGTPSFTQIFDGDLDLDGIPNFLDPDNDNDGIPNLVEYAFNTDPNSNSSLATLKTSTINFLGENYLEIKYDKNSDANDISITIQNSEDLINWNNTSLELISEELDDDNKHKTLTYRTKSPITPESPNFFRFKVSL